MGGGEASSDAPPSRQQRATSAALLWLPFSFLALRYIRLNPDDAFITMRYAHNVLRGWGPVFNEGERVEGFTSPLQLLVAISTQVLPGGFDLLKLKVASLVFAALALVQGARLVDRCTSLVWARNLGRFLLGSSLVFAMNASSGMETALASLLVTAFVVEFTRDAPRRTAVLGVLAIGCVLARPEALGIVAAGALLSAISARRERTWNPIRWAAIPSIGVIVMTVARLAYYGYPVPNTYQAKHVALPGAIEAGLQYITTSWLPGLRWAPAEPGAWVAAMAGVASVGALVIGAAVVLVRQRDLALLPLAVASQVAFILMAGGDWIGRGRFLVPVILVVVTLQVIGVVAATRALGRTAAPMRFVPATAVVVAVVYAIATGPFAAWRSLDDPWDDRALIASEGVLWADTDRLLECAAPGWTVVDGEMGYGPWSRLDLRFIDTRGLMDERLARIESSHHHTWGASDPDYDDTPNEAALEVLRRAPDLVIVNVAGRPPTTLTERYRVVGSWTDGAMERRAYLRKDLTCAGPTS